MNNNNIQINTPPCPAKKTVQHPVLPVSVTFDAGPHTYTDDQGAEYVSVTTLIHAYFPQFDSQAHAARIAARENRLDIEVLADWKAKADKASKYGTKCHAFAEALILGTALPKPDGDMERRAFGIIDRTVVALSAEYEFYPPEQMVFDPLPRTAGTMDLPALHRSSGAFAILDWKTNLEISTNSYGRHGFGPIAGIEDSDMGHYSLQLSTYGAILADAYWIDADRPQAHAVVHIPHTGDDPVWMPLPDCRAAARAMLEHFAGVHARTGYRGAVGALAAVKAMFANKTEAKS